MTINLTITPEFWYTCQVQCGTSEHDIVCRCCAIVSAIMTQTDADEAIVTGDTVNIKMPDGRFEAVLISDGVVRVIRAFDMSDNLYSTLSIGINAVGVLVETDGN